MNRLINLPFGVRGFMKLEATSVRTGRKRVLADWFPNKVLTTGLNRMGTASDWINCGQVGTNSTPPQASDTGLLGYIAGTSNIVSNTFAAQASAPYFGYRRLTYRFAAGATAANLSEAGVGWSTAEGAFLYSRALIVDPDTQLPTTVTPLADEILDLTYELRYYPPLADINGTITLGAATYDTVTRAADVTSASYWGGFIGQEVEHYHLSSSDTNAYDGVLGTLEESPNGVTESLNTSLAGASITTKAYGNNSKQRDIDYVSGPSNWNLGGGVRSIRITTTGGRYQIQFTAQGTGNPIPKTILNNLGLTFRVSWFEGTIV